MTDVTAQAFREAAAEAATGRTMLARRLETLLLAAAEQREVLTRVEKERDTYRALAKVGVWHSACRPNREMAAKVIMSQEQQIAALTAENTTLKAAIHPQHHDCWAIDDLARLAEAHRDDSELIDRDGLDELTAMKTERDEARKLAREAVNGWACYATRKIEHDDISRIHKALDAPTRPA